MRDVKCPDCGTADVVYRGNNGSVDDAEPTDLHGSGPWECLRCDREFLAYPCPYCGSYDIEGNHGVSGFVFAVPRMTLRCLSCREEFLPGSSAGK
jgi:ribosomal protein S27E